MATDQVSSWRVFCTCVQISTFWGSYSTDVVESELLRHRHYPLGPCSVY